MKYATPSHRVYLAKSKIKGAGRGIFAKEDIKKGEHIEGCPVFVLPQRDYPIVKKTALRDYYFMWGKTTAGICFGYGSMYNHSYDANATYQKLIKDQIVEFLAVKDIKRGEEITINYNYGKPNEKKKLWIKSIKPADSKNKF